MAVAGTCSALNTFIYYTKTEQRGTGRDTEGQEPVYVGLGGHCDSVRNPGVVRGLAHHAVRLPIDWLADLRVEDSLDLIGALVADKRDFVDRRRGARRHGLSPLEDTVGEIVLEVDIWLSERFGAREVLANFFRGSACGGRTGTYVTAVAAVFAHGSRRLVGHLSACTRACAASSP